jgi:hypothetical protein
MLILAVSAHATPMELGPHAQQDLELGIGAVSTWPPARRVLPPPTVGPDMRVYGYLAYWEDDLATVPWDDLTDIAIFSVAANSDGTLGSTTNWDIADDAVAMAAPYGVEVHLCVTQFDSTSLTTLLSSSANRATLIAELVDWQARTGAHGVNIDFEGLPYGVKDEMITFTADLEAAVGEVVLATPSVDWAGSWDYSELTRHADLFIMGYGYHYGGSSTAGPTDPMYAGSGTVWSGVQSYSLTWTVDDYLYYGGDPDRATRRPRAPRCRRRRRGTAGRRPPPRPRRPSCRRSWSRRSWSRRAGSRRSWSRWCPGPSSRSSRRRSSTRTTGRRRRSGAPRTRRPPDRCRPARS